MFAADCQWLAVAVMHVCRSYIWETTVWALSMLMLWQVLFHSSGWISPTITSQR